MVKDVILAVAEPLLPQAQDVQRNRFICKRMYSNISEIIAGSQLPRAFLSFLLFILEFDLPSLLKKKTDTHM